MRSVKMQFYNTNNNVLLCCYSYYCCFSQNNNICWEHVPRQRMAAHSASSFNSYIMTKKFSSDHRVTSVCKEHLKSYLHSMLFYCLQFSTHMTFSCCFFFPGRTGMILLPCLLEESQKEEDAHVKNDSRLPWGHYQMIKTVIANSSFSCFKSLQSDQISASILLV